MTKWRGCYNGIMFRTVAFIFAPLALSSVASAQQFEPRPDSPYFKRFEAPLAPRTRGLQLRRGDRLAICGDSITEQKMYSRIIETYLTVCRPDLQIDVRQFGWGGETATGFLRRMDSDVLRFKPTVATTCYGMNDHGYQSYRSSIGANYAARMTTIIEKFQAAGTRVIVGTSGTVGKLPTWASFRAKFTDREDLNLNLCQLRSIDIDLANRFHTGFADVFWPMLIAGESAKGALGSGYILEGGDGVHPGWDGHLVMAHAFLKSFGLDGTIGSIDVDLSSKRARASAGHTIDAFDGKTVRVTSARYPFITSANRSLVPFDAEFNRFILKVSGAPRGSKGVRVTWGAETRSFSVADAARGINLAVAFNCEPFQTAFKQVDDAVLAKQAFETKQIKQDFRSPAARSDMEGVVRATEAERTRLVDAIHNAYHPVQHAITIEIE